MGMYLHETEQFKEEFDNLPLSIQKKYRKQIRFLLFNFFYPSLRIKKMRGYTNRWEARIDYHYRFTLYKEENELILISIGPHDEGLGKK